MEKTNKNKSVAKKLRNTYFFVVGIAYFVAFSLGAAQQWVTNKEVSLSAANATFETFVLQLQSSVDSEVDLLYKYSQNGVFKDWLVDPESTQKKQDVVIELDELANESVNNAFIAFTNYGTCYKFNAQTSYENFNPTSTGEMLEEEDVDIVETKEDTLFGTYYSNEAYHFFIGQYIYDDDGERIGAVASELQYDNYIESFYQSLSSAGIVTFVIEDDGTIVMDSQEANIGKNLYSDSNILLYNQGLMVNDEEVDNVIHEVEAYESGKVYDTSSNKAFSREQNATVVPIDGTNLYVVARYNFEFSSVNNFSPITISAILLTLSFVIIYIIIQKMIKTQFIEPVESLVESMKVVNFFETEVIVGLEREDEFGIIARSVNEVIAQMGDSFPTGFAVMKNDNYIVKANNHFMNQLGVKTLEELNIRMSEEKGYFTVSEVDHERVTSNMKKKVPFFSQKTLLRDDNGKVFWVHEFFEFILSEDGDTFYQVMIININEEEVEKERLQGAAYFDSLTQLRNRTYFKQLLYPKVFINGKYDSLSLILIDIDNFKEINDNYGHDVGDIVLKNVAERIKNAVRGDDILVRWGGEEFLVLLLNAEKELVKVVAERIRVEVDSTNFEITGHVTVSAGISYMDKNDSFETLFKRADIGLYEAKNTGKNKFVEVDKL